MNDSSIDSFFVIHVERWYKTHQRPLPWRMNPTPYSIWLAEIIFQQTRIEQGMKYYLNFIQRYPDIQTLADADEDEILRMWQGLGYYSRAINLLKTARLLARNGGTFPKDTDQLKRLPGIGPYTAGAIASIAFGQRTPLVDGNVTRLITRFFGINAPVNQPDTVKLIQTMAKRLVELSLSPSDYNQGLMDMGSLLCKPVKPYCNECPLVNRCHSFVNNLTDRIPSKNPKPVKSVRYLFYGFIKINGKVVISKRDNQNIWKNLYQLPLLMDTSSVDEKTEFETRHLDLDILNKFKHILTHQILHLTIYDANPIFDKIDKKNIRLVDPELLSELGFPVPFQKFFAKIGN